MVQNVLDSHTLNKGHISKIKGQINKIKTMFLVVIISIFLSNHDYMNPNNRVCMTTSALKYICIFISTGFINQFLIAFHLTHHSETCHIYKVIEYIIKQFNFCCRLK